MYAKRNVKSYLVQKILIIWEKFITTKESLPTQKRQVVTIFIKAHAEGAIIWNTTWGRLKLSIALKYRVNINKDNHSNALRDKC